MRRCRNLNSRPSSLPSRPPYPIPGPVSKVRTKLVYTQGGRCCFLSPFYAGLSLLFFQRRSEGRDGKRQRRQFSPLPRPLTHSPHLPKQGRRHTFPPPAVQYTYSPLAWPPARERPSLRRPGDILLSPPLSLSSCFDFLMRLSNKEKRGEKMRMNAAFLLPPLIYERTNETSILFLLLLSSSFYIYLHRRRSRRRMGKEEE